MKKLTTLLLSGLLLCLLCSTVLASGNKDRYENKIYGTVEQMPDGLYGIWIVAGQPVLVNQQTKIEDEYGRVKVGAYVEIEGRTDAGGFRAYELEVKRGKYRGERADSGDDRYEYGSSYREHKRQEYGNRYQEHERREYGDRSGGYAEGENEFYGTIAHIPQGGLGTWLIGDREIFVDQSTRFENEHGPTRVGARVEVKGIFQNGTFHARKIETKN